MWTEEEEEEKRQAADTVVNQGADERLSLCPTRAEDVK